MYEMSYRIEAGEAAPDFTLQSTTGKSVRLYDCKNKKTVLLFFFNHNDPRCLDRLTGLASDHEQFKKAGVAIFPIDILRLDEGKALAEKLSLPFGILCDDDHTVSRAYGVSECGESKEHVCFEVIKYVQTPTMLIVDTSGIIRYKHVVDASGSPDNATLLDECRKALK